ncbi:asparagine synthase-related protein [Lutibacter sp.]
MHFIVTFFREAVSFSNKTGSINWEILNNEPDKFYEDDEIILWLTGSPRYNDQFISAKFFAQFFLNREIKFIAQLTGQFAGVCFYKKSNKLAFFSDHFGIVPLYYFQKGAQIVISTRLELIIKQLRKNHLLDEGLDIYGLLDVMLFHYFLSNRTPVRQIKRVTGGEFIIWKNHNLTKKIYFNWEALFSGRRNFVEQFERATQIYGVKKPGVTLTGGYDSRTVLASLLKNYSPLHISGFTFGVPGHSQQPIIQNIVEKTGIRYHHFTLASSVIEKRLSEWFEQAVKITDGNPCIIDMPHYLWLSQDMSTNIDAVYTGVLGSEIIRGPVLISDSVMTRLMGSLLRATTSKERFRIFTDYVEQKVPFIKNFPLKNYFELIEYTILNDKQSLKNYDFRKLNLLNYMLFEMLPKFFGNILLMFEHKVPTVNPFADYRFIQALITEKKSFLEFPLLSEHPFHRVKSHQVYAEIIERFYPKLNYIITSRGYPPILEKSLFFSPLIPVFVLYKKLKGKWVHELNYPKWVMNFIDDNLFHYWAEQLNVPEKILREHLLKVGNQRKLGLLFNVYLWYQQVMQ